MSYDQLVIKKQLLTALIVKIDCKSRSEDINYVTVSHTSPVHDQVCTSGSEEVKDTFDSTVIF